MAYTLSVNSSTTATLYNLVHNVHKYVIFRFDAKKHLVITMSVTGEKEIGLYYYHYRCFNYHYCCCSKVVVNR